MSQNITLLGASYTDVPAVQLPKTGGGTAQFDDTTDANATAADIASGKTAYVNGTKITGTGSGGETYYMSPTTGCYYPKKVTQTLVGYVRNNYSTGRWGGCTELEELTINGLTSLNNLAGRVTFNCTNLKKLHLPDLSGSSNSYITSGSANLEEITLGRIGKAMTGLYGNSFSGATSANLVITIYVADSTTIPLANSPFGAANATIVYRSSTTGEVRTST